MSQDWQDIESRKRALDGKKTLHLLAKAEHHSRVDEAMALQSDGCPHRDMIIACRNRTDAGDALIEALVEDRLIWYDDRQYEMTQKKKAFGEIKSQTLKVVFAWIQRIGIAVILLLAAMASCEKNPKAEVKKNAVESRVHR